MYRIPRDRESYALKSIIIQVFVGIVFTLMLLFYLHRVLPGPPIPPY